MRQGRGWAAGGQGLCAGLCGLSVAESVRPLRGPGAPVAQRGGGGNPGTARAEISFTALIKSRAEGEKKKKRGCSWR